VKQLARLAPAEPLPLAPLEQVVLVQIAMCGSRWIVDDDVVELDFAFRRDALDVLAVAEENGEADAFVGDNARGANDLWLLSLGEDDALGISHRAIDDAAHDSAGAAESCLELLAIMLE